MVNVIDKLCIVKLLFNWFDVLVGMFYLFDLCLVVGVVCGMVDVVGL